MTGDAVEVHVEQLVGRRVRDRDGVVIGRLEELRVDIIDGLAAVTECHIGPHAVVERLGGFALQLPFLRLLKIAQHEYRVPWDMMDLSNPHRPTVRCAARELRRVQVED